MNKGGGADDAHIKRYVDAFDLGDDFLTQDCGVKEQPKRKEVQREVEDSGQDLMRRERRRRDSLRLFVE